MMAYLLPANEPELSNLTAAGIALMVGCIGFVLALCGFCFWRLMRSTDTSEHHHVPLDGDPRDIEG